MNICNHISQKKLKYILVFFLISLFFNLFCEDSVSLLTGREGEDSCVFKQMGLSLLQGKELYKDLFDHKGPILFFINAFAQWLNIGRWGLFLLHVLNYTIVFCIWHRICVLNGCKNWRGILVIISGVALYLTIYDIEGNRVEDWCMLPISFSLYIASKELSEEKKYRYEYFILGILAGIIAFIRINNNAIPLCTLFLLLHGAIKRQGYLEVKRIILLVTIGFLLVVLVNFLFFYYKWGWEGIDNLVFGTFTFNISYARRIPHLGSYYTYVLHAILFALLLLYAHIHHFLSKKDEIFYVACFVMSYLAMGKSAFDYYLIAIIPLYIPVLASNFRNSITVFVFFMLLLVSVKRKMLWGNITETISQSKFYNVDNNNFDRILKNIKEDEWSVWNYNASVEGIQILQRNGMTQCNPVIRNFQLDYSERLKHENDGKLEKVSPKWILVKKGEPFINKEDSLFIMKNYRLFDSSSFRGNTIYFYEKVQTDNISRNP